MRLYMNNPWKMLNVHKNTKEILKNPGLHLSNFFLTNPLDLFIAMAWGICNNRTEVNKARNLLLIIKNTH